MCPTRAIIIALTLTGVSGLASAQGVSTGSGPATMDLLGGQVQLVPEST